MIASVNQCLCNGCVEINFHQAATHKNNLKFLEFQPKFNLCNQSKCSFTTKVYVPPSLLQMDPAVEIHTQNNNCPPAGCATVNLR